MGDYRGPQRVGAFLRYAGAKCKRRLEEVAYRTYVTESLRLKGEGMYISASLRELMEPKPQQTAEQIVAETIKRGGLEVRRESTGFDGEGLGR